MSGGLPGTCWFPGSPPGIRGSWNLLQLLVLVILYLPTDTDPAGGSGVADQSRLGAETNSGCERRTWRQKNDCGAAVMRPVVMETGTERLIVFWRRAFNRWEERGGVRRFWRSKQRRWSSRLTAMNRRKTRSWNRLTWTTCRTFLRKFTNKTKVQLKFFFKAVNISQAWPAGGSKTQRELFTVCFKSHHLIILTAFVFSFQIINPLFMSQLS